MPTLVLQIQDVQHILCGSVALLTTVGQNKFVKETPEILEKMKENNHHSETLDQAIAALESITYSDLEEQWDEVSPNTQYVEILEEHETTIHADIYPFLKLHENSNIGFDLGLKQKNTTDMDVVVSMLPENEYTDMVQSLNVEEKQVFYYVLHWLKTSTDTLYVYITGGARVGKTVVVTVLYQTLLRFYNKGIDISPDDHKILLAAPTRKTAYLIKGNTIHNFFAIPTSQGYTYKAPTQDRLNTLRCKFRCVKLLIINEISVVGNQIQNF